MTPRARPAAAGGGQDTVVPSSRTGDMGVLTQRGASVSLDDVVAAACRLFRRKGYRATTVEDIAQEVGILKGSLYHHIESKEQLLLQIFQRTMRRLLRIVKEAQASPLSPQGKLRLLLEEQILNFKEHADDVAVFQAERLRLPPHLAATVRHDIETFDGIVNAIIQEGIDAQVWRPREPRIAMMAIMGMLNWLPNWLRLDGRLSTEEVARLFAGYAEAILRAEEIEGIIPNVRPVK